MGILAISRGRGAHRAFLEDMRGGVAVMAAVMSVPMFGLGALVVDVGLAFVQQTSLRGATDAAALAAVLKPGSATTVAGQSLATNNWSGTLSSATLGIYCPDPALAVGSRFTAGGTTCQTDQYTRNIAGTNAVKVVTAATSPVGLGRLLAAGSTLPIAATATATRIDMAGFSAGTGLVSLGSGGVVNQTLSGLTGSTVNLSAVSYNGLLNANINALSFLQALAVNAGVSAGTYASLASANVTVGQVINAAITALDSPGSAGGGALQTLLTQLSPAAAATSIPVSQIVNLQPYLNDQVTAPGPAALQGGINAYGLVSAVSQIIGSGKTLMVPTGAQPVTIANVSASAVTITVGGIIVQPPVSPAFGFGPVGTTVTESQVLVGVTVTLTNPASLLGLSGVTSATVTIPLFIKLAGGTATLTAIACPAPSSPTTTTMTIAGTTVASQIAIGTVNGVATPAQPQQIASVSILGLGLITLLGSSNTVTQNATPQSVTFTQAQMETSPPTVMTIDSDATLFSSSSSSLKVTLTTGGVVGGALTPFVAPLESAVSSLIGTVLLGLDGPLDGVLNPVLSGLGLRVGYMDIVGNGVRCGVPVLVQ